MSTENLSKSSFTFIRSHPFSFVFPIPTSTPVSNAGAGIRPRGGDHLPPVLLLVRYNGEKGWAAPTELATLGE